MNQPILYGIAQCSTVGRAKDWLESHQIAYTFVDFKKTAPNAEQIMQWINHIGAQKLINRQGLTWRHLTEADKASTNHPEQLIDLLIRKPTLIKRPLLAYRDTLLCGFDLASYQALFQ